MISFVLLFVFIIQSVYSQGTICTGRVPDVVCLNPPWTLERITNVSPWITSVVGVDEVDNNIIYTSGVAIPIQISRNGGYNWTLLDQAGSEPTTTSTVLLPVGVDELVIGSTWQNVPGFPDNNASSFAFYRNPAGEYIAANLSTMPGSVETTRSVGFSYKGMSVTNDVIYAAAYAQYDIFTVPYVDYHLAVSRDRINYEFIKLPDFGGCGPIGSPLPCPGIQFHFFDNMNGVGLFGQHWEGDYYYEPPTTQEYVAIIATTTDGGRSWTQRFRNDTYYTFVDIDCIDNTCWTVVMGLGYSIPDNQAEIWKSTDRGVTWRRVFYTINDNDKDGGLQFTSIKMIDQDFGYAAGNFRQLTSVLITFNGGERWDYAFEPVRENQELVQEVWQVDGLLHFTGFYLSEGYTTAIRLNPPESVDPINQN